MSIAASFYFLSFRHQCVHSSIHHSMRTKPLSNTDRQTPSLSYFPYKLFPTTKNEKLSLSLSILYHTNPPLTASTHISTHFWLWASDTHLFVSLHKSLKDPQMCAPLISISKKNHLPPSIIHLSVHPLLQTHYYTQLINDKPFFKETKKNIRSLKGEYRNVADTDIYVYADHHKYHLSIRRNMLMVTNSLCISNTCLGPKGEPWENNPFRLLPQ